MQLKWDEIQANAIKFSKRWENGKDEKSEGQSFVRDFLAVFGVEDAAEVGRFEDRALRESGLGYMDYFWSKRIAIEMKTRGKDLKSAYDQLKDYVFYLHAEDMPDLLMVSDFENIVLYHRTTRKRNSFKTKDLHKNVRQFANIAGYETTREIVQQLEVNVKAAEKMAKLHDALKSHGYEGFELEVYLVRLLFCLFADDTGIFPQDIFTNYIQNSKEDGSDLSDRIARVFEILNMPEEVRVKRTLLSADLKQFRYINGTLFKDSLSTADFDANMRKILIDCCLFDWSHISPAIFGAMFQGVMDKEKRREIGAHYTSEENIIKLINPLFMDDLWKEFDRVKIDPKSLERFHEKIAQLKFLDPACGCGNFLIITYRELRMLELEILKMKNSSDQRILDISSMLKVSVEQFYGIEIEEFPCQVAMAGMWLMDHLMNLKASEQFGMYYARLPLMQSATIVHDNALQIDWESCVPENELSYILGNPPFVGARFMSSMQKEDMMHIFGDKFKGVGNLDYVTAWYKKTADYIKTANIKCSFVSTNSITQGEQVALLWKPLIEEYNVKIDFAYRTFVWSNEAKGKAAVYCVIVGFSSYTKNKNKNIYENDGTKIKAKNINPYLVAAPNIFIESRSKSLCDVPQMDFGNMPNDAKGLLSNYSTEQKAEIILKFPETSKWFKRLLGAEEFINNIERWCIWLKGVSPTEIAKSHFLKDILEKIRNERQKSTREATRKLAETPYLFGEIRQPTTDYIIIPRVSSERRKYIPIGFLSPDIIVNDSVQLIPNAALFHFGILTSNVHMAWTRAVCGRLKSDYRYSKDIVYNNFPWPDTNDKQKAAIEKLAQAVLDARLLFPESSLADFYDPLTMPPELLKAHKALDVAAMKLYNFGKDMSEADIVAALMERYQKLSGELFVKTEKKEKGRKV